MKTIFRNLGLGILMAGCAAVTATHSFAQDAPQDVCKEVEPKQALYKQFTDNIPKNATLDQTKTAVKAGDDYVQKYGACPEDKEIVTYLNTYLPGMKKAIVDTEAKQKTGALLTRIDTAAKSKNVPEVFASGKEILSKESDFADVALDVNIALVSAGFEQSIANPPVDTYNADTINYAKSAIQKIEGGKTSKAWGVWSYNLKPGDKNKYSDEKSYALGALNYIIGYVTFRQGKTDASKKKEALPYYYKSLQYNSFSKTDPTVYQAFGAWYLDEAKRIDGIRAEKVKAAGNKDTDETIALLADQKGYADRAIDAYARAYKLAKDDKNPKKEYVDGLYSLLKDLYAFRYENNTGGSIDTFVASVMNNPLPDPTTPITPVKEETPAPATTSNASNTTTQVLPNTTTPTTKPATTVPNTTKPPTTPTPPVKKPVSTTKSSEAANETANTAPKAKKPAPKKKGTR